MADFCGLTRVKTWRWSRLFACAVAVLCALSPIKSFANGYMCEDYTAKCNAGFGWSNNGTTYDKCVVCPENTYNATRADWAECTTCPSGGTCPRVFLSGSGNNVQVSTTSGDYDYGRPVVLCGKDYYRTFENGIFGCSACPNGSTREAADSLADTMRGLGKKIEGTHTSGTAPGGTFQYNGSGVMVFVFSDLSPNNNENLCTGCRQGYYQKGVFNNDASSYNTPSTRCASCQGISNSDGDGCTPEGHVSCVGKYYREVQSDGKVKCSICRDHTTKDADSNSTSDDSYWLSGSETCNRCEQDRDTKYYYSQKSTPDSKCFACPDFSIRDPSTGMCGSTVTQRKGANDIRCQAGYYRVTNTSTTGEVGCVACDPTNVSESQRTYTTKDADQTPGDGSGQACQKCISGAYYYSQNEDEYKCYKCPDNAYKWNDENGVRVCNTTARERGKANDIKCDAGYYRVTHTSGEKKGQVECVQCPKGYTKDKDGDSVVEGVQACNKCASDRDNNDISDGVNWFRVPNTSVQKAGECVPCPTGDGIASCRDGDDEKHYLLCDAGYYRSLDASGKYFTCDNRCSGVNKPADSWDAQGNNWGYGPSQCTGEGCQGGYFSPSGNYDENNCIACVGTPNVEYLQCENNVIMCNKNYYYDSTTHACTRCPTIDGTPNGMVIAGKDADTTNVINNTTGKLQCNTCSDGLFAPAGTTAGPDTCVYCPENALNNCDGGVLACKANYYYQYDSNKLSEHKQYQCLACPALTGKLADRTNMVGSSSSGVSACNICTNGWYGNMGNNAPDVSYCSGECPVFTRLDELGICVRGTTARPSDTDTSFSNSSVQACYMPNASTNVVGDNTLFNDQSYTVYPTFSDTEGLFRFIGSPTYSTPQACDIPSRVGEVSDMCSNLGEGKYCVYIKDEVTINTALNTNACIKAIMWRTEYEYTGGVNRFAISDTTARMVYSHWGKNNPWFCTKDQSEANAFITCLTGASGASEYCLHNSRPCASASQVVKCQIDASGDCVTIND